MFVTVVTLLESRLHNDDICPLDELYSIHAMNSLRQQAAKFARETTFHGFDRVADKDASVPKKLFWVAALTTSYVIAGAFVLESWRQWLSHPIVTTVDTMDRPIAKIDEPAITVCQGDKVPFDRWGLIQVALSGVNVSQVAELDVLVDAFMVEMWFGLYETLEEMDIKEILNGEFCKVAQFDLCTQGASGDLMKSLLVALQKDVERSDLKKTLFKALKEQFLTSSSLRSYIKFDSFVTPAIRDTFDVDQSAVDAIDLDACKESETCKENFKSSLMLSIVGKELLKHSPENAGDFLAHFATLLDGGFSEGASLWPVLEAETELINEENFEIHNLFDDVFENISLIEIPSLFGSGAFRDATINKEVKGLAPYENFAYSVLKSNGSCSGKNFRRYFRDWQEFYDGKREISPCLNSQNECCTEFTSRFEDFKSLMDVMKFALRPINAPKANPIIKQLLNGLKLTYEENKRVSFPLIPRCLQQGEDDVGLGVKNCAAFGPILTDRGVCYAMNAPATNELFSDSSYVDSFCEAFGNFSSYSPDHKGLVRYLVLDAATSMNPKLDRIIYPNFFVSVLPFAEPFDTRSTAVEVRAGFVTSLKVTPRVIESSENMRYSEAETRDCLFENEGELKLLDSYSHSGCLFECSLDIAKAKCGCLPWNYPRSDDDLTMLCDLFGNKCFENTLSRMDPPLVCSQCKKDCEKVTYTVHESAYPVGDAMQFCALNTLGIKTLKEVKESHIQTIFPNRYLDCSEILTSEMAIVRVEFAGRTAQVLYQDVSSTLQGRVAAIGGTLGLFSGMSIIGLVDLVVFVFTALYRAMTRTK